MHFWKHQFEFNSFFFDKFSHKVIPLQKYYILVSSKQIKSKQKKNYFDHIKECYSIRFFSIGKLTNSAENQKKHIQIYQYGL